MVFSGFYPLSISDLNIVLLGKKHMQQLTADMEKALLQQVMSLGPEQVNMLPPEQRNQVLQLQRILRQQQ